jgi:hypothetical protein
MQRQQQAQLRGLGCVRVLADEPPARCPACDGPMRLRKTLERGGVTLAHGSFRVREAERVCAAGCTEVAADRKRHVLARRPDHVAALLLPRSTVGYDVMAHVGLQRFVHHRQREEIRSDLAARFGVERSAGEISALGSRFCVYLKALHEERAQSLREALAADGGWPMHIGATGEDGQGTLLCLYAGWRGWVLGAFKIPTERAESILPRMQQTARLFGPPCAVMRDLGRAVIEACRDFVASQPAPIPNLDFAPPGKACRYRATLWAVLACEAGRRDRRRRTAARACTARRRPARTPRRPLWPPARSRGCRASSR